MRYFRVLLGCLAALALHAQTTSTTILGTVTDPTGASVQGAKIVARNVGTSVSTETTTTSPGDFALPLLDIGEYEVSAETGGFKAETKEGRPSVDQRKSPRGLPTPGRHAKRPNHGDCGRSHSPDG